MESCGSLCRKAPRCFPELEARREPGEGGKEATGCPRPSWGAQGAPEVGGTGSQHALGSAPIPPVSLQTAGAPYPTLPLPGRPRRGSRQWGCQALGRGEERRGGSRGREQPPGMPGEPLQLQPRRPGRAPGHPGAARRGAARRLANLTETRQARQARGALPNPAILTCPEKGVHVRVRRSPFLRGPLRRVHDCWGTGQRSPGLQGGRGARRRLQNRDARGWRAAAAASRGRPGKPSLASPRSG